jgi:hypothetical protein
MKRTKEWWSMLDKDERSHLVYLERASNMSSGYGGLVPDDCSSCTACGQVTLGGGLCPECSDQLDYYIEKANRAVKMKNYTIIRPDPQLENNLMAFGFMCGPGWYPLIYETLDAIQLVVDRDGLDLEVAEIKEKYGALRIYMSGYVPEVEEIIKEATRKSLKICEVCGESGERIDRSGWLMTRCNKCLEKG